MSPLLRVIDALAYAAAAARRARAVHPRGRTFTATLTTSGSRAHYGVDLLDRAGSYSALVRLSRSVGLPAGVPDVLGVAVRVHDGDGPGVDVDLLFSTVLTRAPIGRHLLFPRLRIGSTYTSITGYRTRLGRRYLAVVPGAGSAEIGSAEIGPAEIGSAEIGAGADGRGSVSGRALLLTIAARYGPWRTFGRIDIGDPVPDDVDRRLAFDPMRHQAPGLAIDGLLRRLRVAAYDGSRRGRGGSDL